jgi:flagella basal body P-ring formation protein FlgA
MDASPLFRRAAGLALAWWLVGLSIDTSADAPATGDPVVVRLKARAEVPARVVTVGHVADLNGGPAALRAQIARIDLEDFGPATSLTIKRRQIELRLRLTDLPAAAYQVGGEDEVVALAVRQPLSSEVVVRAAMSVVRKRLPWPEEDLSIRLVQPVTAALPAVSDPAEATVRAEPHNANVGPGRVQMDVSVFVAGEKKLMLPVYLDVRVIQPVVIARKGLGRGDVLTQDTTITDRRAIDAAAKVPAPDAVLGRKLRRPLAAGAVVHAADVEDLPTQTAAVLVKARQPVKLLARSGAFTIRADGEAMQEGRLDDLVRVQNTASKKVVVGKVTGPGVVEIE